MQDAAQKFLINIFFASAKATATAKEIDEAKK